MITTLGKTNIKNFFGGQTTVIGGSLAVGTGGTPEQLSDTGLEFEVLRVDVTVAPDLDNGRIVFKGTLPAGSVGTIYELGLYNSVTLTNDIMINLASANWTNASLVTTNSRVAANAIEVTASANTTTTAELSTDLGQDASAFLATDSIVVAFTGDSNLSALKVRLGNSAAAYREFSFTPGSGYTVARQNVSTGTDTGTVDMASISYAAIVATAGAGGATTVYLDGLRFESNTGVAQLVARKVLDTPEPVDATIPTEVEYSLDIIV